MPTYTTYDQFDDLTLLERATARPLRLKAVTEPELKVAWENGIIYSTIENFGTRAPIFSFLGTAGAGYGVVSSSHFDPDTLVVYDKLGNAIAYDTGSSGYGTDSVLFTAPYSGFYYVNASWSQGFTPSERASAVGVYEDLDSVPKRNIIKGTAGNDIIDETAHADIVDGGAGLDTFSVGWSHDQYLVEVKDGVVLLSDRDYSHIVDTLENVERIWFGDGYLSFETEGYVAEAYRLYQAAFDRKPDAEGLGFWIGAMSNGTTLETVADGFMKSDEFTSLYGKAPSNHDIVMKLYWNILDRAPDQEGFNFWKGALDNNTIDAVDLLVAFSESAENTQNTFDAMNAGYFFYY